MTRQRTSIRRTFLDVFGAYEVRRTGTWYGTAVMRRWRRLDHAILDAAQMRGGEVWHDPGDGWGDRPIWPPNRSVYTKRGHR